MKVIVNSPAPVPADVVASLTQSGCRVACCGWMDAARLLDPDNDVLIVVGLPPIGRSTAKTTYRRHKRAATGLYALLTAASPGWQRVIVAASPEATWRRGALEAWVSASGGRHGWVPGVADLPTAVMARAAWQAALGAGADPECVGFLTWGDAGLLGPTDCAGGVDMTLLTDGSTLMDGAKMDLRGRWRGSPQGEPKIYRTDHVRVRVPPLGRHPGCFELNLSSRAPPVSSSFWRFAADYAGRLGSPRRLFYVSPGAAVPKELRSLPYPAPCSAPVAAVLLPDSPDARPVRLEAWTAIPYGDPHLCLPTVAAPSVGPDDETPFSVGAAFCDETGETILRRPVAAVSLQHSRGVCFRLRKPPAAIGVRVWASPMSERDYLTLRDTTEGFWWHPAIIAGDETDTDSCSTCSDSPDELQGEYFIPQ